MSLLLEAFVQAVTEMSVPPTLDPPHIRAQRRFPKPKAEEPLETRSLEPKDGGGATVP